MASRLSQTLGARKHANCSSQPIGSRCPVSPRLFPFRSGSCVVVPRAQRNYSQFIFMRSFFSRVNAGTLAGQQVRVPRIGCFAWHLSLLACSPVVSSRCDRSAIADNLIGIGTSFRMACTLLVLAWLLRRLGTGLSVVGSVRVPRRPASVSMRPNLSVDRPASGVRSPLR